MTGTGRSSDGLDAHRRRALIRSWRRGTREMDLVLGRFADAHIADLSDHDLADFEALLEVPDQELFAWITGAAPVPRACASPLFDSIVAFHARRHDET